MQKLIRAGLVLGLVAAALPALAETPSGSLAALSTQPSMNVFRRFAVDRERMIEFYGEVLGLKQLPSLRLGGGNEMILFEIGTAQVKLQATPAASQYPGGAVKEATGLRVFTFFYPDEAALTSRFAAKGYPAPSFTARAAAAARRWCSTPRSSGSSSWCSLARLPKPTAASRRASPRRTSRRAARSIARSSVSRNWRRLPTRCSARRGIRSATATPPSTCGRSVRRCRPTRAAPAFSTW